MVISWRQQLIPALIEYVSIAYVLYNRNKYHVTSHFPETSYDIIKYIMPNSISALIKILIITVKSSLLY